MEQTTEITNSDFGVYYTITPNLRYKTKEISISETTSRGELRLQQMWQGSDGSIKWEWIEEVE